MGEVRFVGARTDVPLWMAAADVVVVPSRWEGMALVPLEAMACARSVVATDVNGVVDSIPSDAGAIVQLDDEDALADALVHRLLDPVLAEEEGWRGRAHVETHHDVASSARELARVYLRLVGARRGR
jgi:glycosyltransferase involved in cell wall biosynthesis